MYACGWRQRVGRLVAGELTTPITHYCSTWRTHLDTCRFPIRPLFRYINYSLHLYSLTQQTPTHTFILLRANAIVMHLLPYYHLLHPHECFTLSSSTHTTSWKPITLIFYIPYVVYHFYILCRLVYESTVYYVCIRDSDYGFIITKKNNNNNYTLSVSSLNLILFFLFSG